ncbi:TonB-dependent receptor [soil metagenome]
MVRNGKSRTIGVITGGAAVLPICLITASPIAAQNVATPTDASAQPKESYSASEIIVTAEKRSNVVSRVPISIAAFSGDQLQQFNVTQVADLVKIVPGFTYAKSEQNTPIYTIRGVGFRTPNMSSTSPVGIYLDEVGYPYPYMAQGLDLDVERVEVLKGPQGTLFGRNTTGGLINFVSRKPSDNTEGSVHAFVGNYQTYGGDLVLSGPISGPLSGRIAARLERSDEGWQKSVTRDDRLGKVDRFQARATLRWEGAAGTNILLTGSYWQDRSDTQAPQIVQLQEGAPGFSDPRILPSIVPLTASTQADWPSEQLRRSNETGVSIPPYKVDAKFYGVALRIEQPLTDTVTLTSVSGYNHVKRGDISTKAGGGLLVLGDTQQDGRIEDFSTELRLSGTSGGLSWIAGVSYNSDSVTDNSTSFIPNNSQSARLKVAFVRQALGPNSFTASQIAGFFSLAQLRLQYSAKSYSAFGNATWEVSPQFSLSGGLRYTSYKGNSLSCTADVNNSLADADNYLFGALLKLPPTLRPNNCITLADDPTTGASLPAPPEGVRNQLKDNNLSGNAVVKWTPTNSTMIYASYSRGYNVGQFPVVSVSLAKGLRPVQPETLDAIEIGVKTHEFDRNVQLNIAGYYYKYHDKQSFNKFLDPFFGANPTIVNVPDSTIWGMEAGVSWRLMPGINLNLDANYMRTRINRFVGYTETAVLADFKGNELTFSPRFQSTASLTVKRPISDKLDVTGLAAIAYQSSSYSSLDNDPRYKNRGYATVDLSIGIAEHTSGWTLQAYAKNVFNEYYWNSQVYAADTLVRYAGMPRTFGLRAGYEF